ncbi:MAG TPA: hypothetical protein VMH04_24290 [Candidatus Solibacter sp.]|nr:hypothetical protein [Candidatus Solibacter sp.]
MSKKLLIAMALLIVLPFAGGAKLAAQDSSASNTASESAEPGHAYRLDFTVNEINDGKKINSRQYSMNLNAGDQSEIKIGTRVPVETKGDQFQYLDVGTSIWCRMRDRRDVTWLGNDVLLNVRSEVSDVAAPEQGTQAMGPIVRQMKIDASTIAVVGKAVVVGVVDDPNSKRQFQLEVVATKLR